MKISASIVRSEREKRAWSQEHLASVSDLGVRTIIRIEKNGLASPESVKALAAVFELQTSDLQPSPQQTGDYSVSVPSRLAWLVPVMEFLVKHARLLDHAIVTMKSSYRLAITFGCFALATLFYFISFSLERDFGFPQNFLAGAFLFAGAGFEIIFWFRIFPYKRRQQQKRLEALREAHQ